jgi:hypothetical protein
MLYQGKQILTHSFITSARLIKSLCLILIFCCSTTILPLKSQTPFPPPNQLQVFNAQGLGFGSFYVGATGGTVVMSPGGSRSTTGTVMGLASDPGMPAIFNVRLVPGRLVHINFSSSATLTRTGGSETLTITGFNSDKPGNSFVTTGGHPFINPVQVGGTLNVGSISANPSGEYQGFFEVTFIQE